jgi:phenylalanyl-tRNA synthetase beta chain
MKISLNWLKEYVDISGLTAEQISATLTMAGLEVEEMDDQGKKLDKFVIGYVETKEKHPKADRLSVCTVNTGSEVSQIVCGAPNVAAGQKVPVALLGAIVPANGMEISKVKLRGVESSGMICAEDELGIGTDHAGIMILPEDAPVGKPLAEYLGLNDVIFEIGITPNRPDALSHIGVARDIAALFNRELKLPSVPTETGKSEIENYAGVVVEDSVNCPRYAAKVVKNVTIGESPAWLKTRLKAVGLRPINNIVDVTNFIMFELGQPLHGFDLDALAGKKIVVKQAGTASKFVTLDSKERTLPSNALMICDGEKPVAVAGVMGGENSEVTANTKNILIESAYFNPPSVRKTAKALGLSTDSSYRFERGIDYANSVFAAQRAAQLMAEVSGGEIVPGYIDIYPEKKIAPEVTLRYKRVEKILGFAVPADKIDAIVKNLGFTVVGKTQDTITVTVPAFRPDIEREIDIIEEIARINGYDEIPTISSLRLPMIEIVDVTEFAGNVKNALTALGFFEVLTNSLTSVHLPEFKDNAIKMLNPQSSDMAGLRTSLLPGLLSTIKKNANVGEKDLKLFEYGRIFRQLQPVINSFDDFIEEESIGIVLTGNADSKEWFSALRPFDFYDLKGFVNSFIAKISLDNYLIDSYYPQVNNIFDYSFSKLYQNQVVGTGGKLSSEILHSYGIDAQVYYFEFSVPKLKQIPAKVKIHSELLKFPKVSRDCAFVLDKNVDAQVVTDFIKKNAAPILQHVGLFDIFESDSLGVNKKSLAFALEYYDFNKTLTDDEVEKDFNSIIKKVSSEFNAVLRG